MSNKIFPTDTVVKATLIAADQFFIADSADSNKSKDITGTILNTFIRGAGGNVTVLTSEWTGLGAAKGRIAFTDAAVDLASVLDSAVLVGSGTPDQAQVAGDAYVTGKFEADGIVYADGGMIISESIDWASGNITYVPIGGDIETYVASATAGDTLKLASGTYTITDDIDVGVGVNIVGQGIGKTTIACATIDKSVFDISVSNVRIADLTITNTGGSTTGSIGRCIHALTNLTGLVFENLEINASGVGNIYATLITGSDATLRDVVIDSSSSNDKAYGLYLYNYSATLIDKTVNCYNVKSTADGTGDDSNAFVVYNNNEASALTLNLYDCYGTALVGGSADAGLYVFSTTTNNAVANVYGGTYKGADYDVLHVGANVVTLYDTTLVNGTTSGTISYGGTVVTNRLEVTSATYPPASITRTTAGTVLPYAGLRIETVTSSNMADGFGSAITLGGGDSGISNKVFAQIQGIRDGADTEGALAFLAGTNGSEEFMRIANDGAVQSTTLGVKFQHDEIGSLLSTLTSPVAIVGFTGTGASASTETGYENGAGRTWTYSGGLTTDKIFQGQTYVYSFDGVDSYLSTPDTADMSFGDGSSDSAFSIGGWIEVVAGSTNRRVITKYDVTTGSTAREWILSLSTDEKLKLLLVDESAGTLPFVESSALSVGWHYVVATYDGSGGNDADDGMNMYINGVLQNTSKSGTVGYTAMENTGADVYIGCDIGAGGTPTNNYKGDMGRLFVTAEELSASKVWKLYEQTRGFYNK